LRVVTSKRSGRILVVIAYLVALGVALAIGRASAAMPPIAVAAIADLAATATVFAFSVLLDNSSVYDPYWSVAPPIVAGYWATLVPTAGLGARQFLILCLILLWGIRLTANWGQRWGGPADEDFRYREIRGKTGRAYWPASFVSIHLLPTVWVFLGLLPLFPALAQPGDFGILDAAACLVTAAAITIETVADQQLRRFLRSPRQPGAVLDSGLWGRCRHPNYLGEVLFWWGLFLFGIAARPGWAWTVVGPLSITLLFVFISVPWMDRHMLARHAGWAEQMKQTPPLIPWRRRRPGSAGTSPRD
jgi:steroid 5-alpha reductase family enzyme